MKFEESLAQLETLVAKLEAGNIDLDQLSAEIKRAEALIGACKKQLGVVQAEVAALQQPS